MTLVSKLPSPEKFKRRSIAAHQWIQEARQSAQNVLMRKDPRLVLIVGPCSIHDRKAAVEYARRLKDLMPSIQSSFFPIMRIFIEKPRTLTGWKGILYDPFLDGSNDIASGIELARDLFVEITEMGVPCATELLDPLVTPYFDDLIVWGLIGARTTASQPHRQLASGLMFPVGFKNDCRGETDAAIAGIFTSRAPHSHLGLNEDGFVSAIQTEGNPWTHLVLRGSEKETNFDEKSINEALSQLMKCELEPRIVIDCSHGNSGKDHRRQKIGFESVIDQVLAGNGAIAGLMLESNLFEGKQRLDSCLSYGISITDSCIGWEETASLLLSADSRLSIAISSVQK